MTEYDKSTDNRMAWILQFEENRQNNNSTNVSYCDYEICSEVDIQGFLNYDNGSVCFGYIYRNEDSYGLYGYILRIKKACVVDQEAVDGREQSKKILSELKNSKNSYCSHGGIISELYSIFSVFFGVRFFLKSESLITGEFRPDKISHKIFYPFNYSKPNNYINIEMLSGDRRDWAKSGKLELFLNKIKAIDQKYHQAFHNSFFWYSEAVKEIGQNYELFYIKMVSCIEALLGNEKFPDELDKKMREILKDGKFNKNEMTQVCSWLKHRNLKKRFVNFLSKYSEGFPVESENSGIHIQRCEYECYFKRIYDARSGYLHAGEPMYLSANYTGEIGQKWDLDGSQGKNVDRKYFDYKKQLPRVRWFERIVNYCLKKYVDEKTSLKSKPTPSL